MRMVFLLCAALLALASCGKDPQEMPIVDEYEIPFAEQNTINSKLVGSYTGGPHFAYYRYVFNSDFTFNAYGGVHLTHLAPETLVLNAKYVIRNGYQKGEYILWFDDVSPDVLHMFIAFEFTDYGIRLRGAGGSGNAPISGDGAFVRESNNDAGN